MTAIDLTTRPIPSQCDPVALGIFRSVYLAE